MLPRFFDLSPELIELVASFLDRRSAVALMRTSRALPDILRPFIWCKVSGIDAVLDLLPCTRRVVLLSPDESDSEDSDAGDEEDDAIAIGGHEEYDCPTQIPVDTMKRCKEYTKLIKVLEVHESTKKAIYHGLRALFSHAPLFPALETLILSPRGYTTVSPHNEVNTVLQLCGNITLRVISLTKGSGDEGSSIDIYTGRDILSTLATHDLRLRELEITNYVQPLTFSSPRLDQNVIRRLESLTTVTLHGRALLFLSLGTLSTLPHLTNISLHDLDFLPHTSLLPPRPETRPFPSLECVVLQQSMYDGTISLLEILRGAPLRSLTIDIFHSGVERTGVTLMLESLTNYASTLRALKLSIGPHSSFGMGQRDIAALSTLRNLVEFKCLSLVIGDPKSVLDLLQHWSSVESLTIPCQYMDAASLEGLASACMSLSYLSVRLTGISSLPTVTSSQLIGQNASHSSHTHSNSPFISINSISPGILTLRCGITGKSDRVHGSLLAKLLHHCWRQVELKPLECSDADQDIFDWVAEELSGRQ